MVKRFALCAFVENNHILLQDRTGISKWGEDWSIFGGGIEGDETPLEAVTREMNEELALTNLSFTLLAHKETEHGEGFLFTASMPDLTSLQVYEGAGFQLFPLNEVSNINIIPAHLSLLKQAKLV